ncbi:MAG TPA: class II aldolase/adducin family protein [Candidatus Hydrogenedentes bacterium]|nr:class II aldolase/adducin family protein [Candidatus Hydrogenedentota bacterium]HOL75581.1 class II aldolase/adducin family protein [Candidatus Hydrogenedentota bacterium]HPO86995.1 class II aldolase/adducin family protein [Candidatus Hydrogenedentota bacterium]
MNQEDLREAICEVGRRMYANGFVSATDGNISIRLAPDRFLCTPSGISKGFMKPDDLLIADDKGNKIAGTGKVTSEFFTHLAAYEERPDISAVCHAHPVHAIACTLVGISLTDAILPEVVMSLGGIPTVEYATPAGKEGAEVIRDTIRRCDALIISRHGTITVGHDVFAAYFNLEKLEHAARTILLARGYGEIPALSTEEVEKLHAAHERYGGGTKLYKLEE